MKGLQQKAPFDSLEPDKLRRTAIAMSLRQAKGGEVVVKEGEKGDECFLVEAGELKVSVGGKEVDTVATGALFGELAVLYNVCLLYTSPSPRDQRGSRMPSSA